MTDAAKKLLQEALGLSNEERAALAATLIESLDESADGDLDEQWRAEIRRRLQQLDAGAIQAIDWIDARKMILG